MKRHWWMVEDMPGYARSVERHIQREIDRDLYFMRNLNQGGRYEIWHRPPHIKPYHVMNLTTREGKMLVPGDNLGADFLKRKLERADLSKRLVRESFDRVVDHNIERKQKLEQEEDDMISAAVREDLDMIMEKPRQFVPDNLEH
jgi:hypothetical protein